MTNIFLAQRSEAQLKRNSGAAILRKHVIQPNKYTVCIQYTLIATTLSGFQVDVKRI